MRSALAQIWGVVENAGCLIMTLAIIIGVPLCMNMAHSRFDDAIKECMLYASYDDVVVQSSGEDVIFPEKIYVCDDTGSKLEYYPDLHDQPYYAKKPSELGTVVFAKKLGYRELDLIAVDWKRKEVLLREIDSGQTAVTVQLWIEKHIAVEHGK